MKEFLDTIAYIGTNEWIKAFWSNNWIILSIVLAPIGAWLKGKHPDFWAKLSTMIPFIGKPGNRL